MELNKMMLLFLIAFFLHSKIAFANFDLDCYIKENCESISSKPAPSSSSAQIKINPSAVPTEKGLGLEGIFLGDYVDVSFVRGTGVMGASISPSNSENTFFGAPGFELASDFLNRNIEKKKYISQKYTLATAFEILKSSGGGLGKRVLKIGVMGKYNKISKGSDGGGGLSGVLGPFEFGYSIYNDQSFVLGSCCGLSDSLIKMGSKHIILVFIYLLLF